MLMLSDVHFDPFRDPVKVAKLDKAPVSEWEAILKEPYGADQPAALQALLGACGAKAADTDEALFDAALKEAKVHAPEVKFVTISGDLLVHQFDCRYHTAMKGKEAKDGLYAFAAKAADYVTTRVMAEFPKAPVYAALGNNDSGCEDYELMLSDHFLADSSADVMKGLRGASEAEVKQAREDYERLGSYAVTLPAPLAKTRLLVVEDIYLSRNYKTCGGKTDPKPAQELMTWLGKQLDDAKAQGENVWVMAHIPAGVDVYATLRKGDVCTGAPVQMFLTPELTTKFNDVLLAHADEVKLGIFGHTHMDEVRVLESADGAAVIPIKGVASITPINGNRPSFTVGRVSAASGVLTDYAVWVSPTRQGTGVWMREYGFDEAYHAKDYGAAELKALVSGFDKDKQGADPATQSYMQYFDPGAPFSPLLLGWPQYACGIGHYTEASYKACSCAAEK